MRPGLIAAYNRVSFLAGARQRSRISVISPSPSIKTVIGSEGRRHSWPKAMIGLVYFATAHRLHGFPSRMKNSQQVAKKVSGRPW